MTLSVVCVTKAERHAWPFLESLSDLATALGAELVIAADGLPARNLLSSFVACHRLLCVESKGYIESVLDEAVNACSGEYVLRLDDDERCSPAMVEWLFEDRFLESDHWCFARAHLWPDEQSMLLMPHLWPDEQTRLSIRAKSGGRHGVHAGSPFGGGERAPVSIEHHKFLVRSHADRLAIAQQYDAYHPGYGTGDMKPFSLPEDVYTSVVVAERGSGLVDFTPRWRRDEVMR